MPEANRTGPPQRRTSIALAFVLLAIAALVALPWAGALRSRPLYDELTDVLSPARELVSRIQVALALEGSLLRDYLASRDASLTARYRDAVRQELSATDSLAALVATLGPDPRAQLAEFRREQTEWHALIERVLAGSALTHDPLRGPDYEELLDTSLRLDAVLDSASQVRRASIARSEETEARLAIALGMLALLAAIAVGWLANQMRRYATTLELRTAEVERAVEGRARLMRGVTHDLKNPLHTIEGHAQLLEDGLRGPVTPEQRDSIGRIRKSVKALLALIEDLMDLARAEAGQLRITPRPVDIVSVMREAVEQNRPASELSSHAINVAAPDPLPAIITDPLRVRQVLDNLLSNAIKYTPPGGQIVVRAEPRERPAPDGRPSGPWVAIDVCDSGAGIPPEQQQAIFADFTRLEAHRALPGAGLGLSISRRVAHLLGGDLTLRSAPGDGATFTLWLPQHRGSPQDQA
jgi:signal transduction histidine kinase